MAISMKRYGTTAEMLMGLAAALIEVGMFDTVSVETDTLIAEKDNVTLFTMGLSGTTVSYSFINTSGTTVNSSTFLVNNMPGYFVSTCGTSVMVTCHETGYSDNRARTFVFGLTQEGSVYMGYGFRHTGALSDGTVSMCENTAVMYNNPYLHSNNSNPLWSRFAPICVQSQTHTIETADGIYGMIERHTSIPITGGAFAPTQFIQNGKTYLTDGSFVIEDREVTS